jgi:hypothetical protein
MDTGPEHVTFSGRLTRHTFLNSKCSWMIVWTFPAIIPLLDEISRTVILFPKINPSALWMFTSHATVDWTWACGRSLQHSENLLYQSQKLSHVRIFSPYRAFNLWKIAAGFTLCNVEFDDTALFHTMSDKFWCHLLLAIMCVSGVHGYLPSSECKLPPFVYSRVLFFRYPHLQEWNKAQVNCEPSTYISTDSFKGVHILSVFCVHAK